QKEKKKNHKQQSEDHHAQLCSNYARHARAVRGDQVHRPEELAHARPGPGNPLLGTTKKPHNHRLTGL
ncbi:hypothetical protein PUR57_00205, partial [Streptomyces sp. JV176]|uniref:hypothetical protein n=1 Tax=Streptomyces sp. JV176 TaxID=858630 RepID=UPI002E793381